MRPKGLNHYPCLLSLFDPEVALHLTKLIITAELQNTPWHTNGTKYSSSLCKQSLQCQSASFTEIFSRSCPHSKGNTISASHRDIFPSLFTFSLSFTESWPHFVYSTAPVWSHKVSLNASHIKPVQKGTLPAKQLDSISFFYCLFVLRLCSSQYSRFYFAFTKPK